MPLPRITHHVARTYRCDAQPAGLDAAREG